MVLKFVLSRKSDMKSKNDITLILPVAGKSSRFKTNLPKWLLESLMEI